MKKYTAGVAVTRSTGRRLGPRLASRLVALAAAALACLGTTAAMHAQVAAADNRALGALSIYGLASADDNQFNYPHTLGGSGGITVMHTRLFGLTGEGSAIRWRAPVHDYTAVAGPTFVLPVGRLRPFAEILGGIGHAGYLERAFLPARHLDQSYGFAYAVAAGVDLRLTRHFSWRLVQANYTHIAAGPGVSTETGSTGIVFRFF